MAFKLHNPTSSQININLVRPAFRLVIEPNGTSVPIIEALRLSINPYIIAFGLKVVPELSTDQVVAQKNIEDAEAKVVEAKAVNALVTPDAEPIDEPIDETIVEEVNLRIDANQIYTDSELWTFTKSDLIELSKLRNLPGIGIKENLIAAIMAGQDSFESVEDAEVAAE